MIRDGQIESSSIRVGFGATQSIPVTDDQPHSFRASPDHF